MEGLLTTNINILYSTAPVDGSHATGLAVCARIFFFYAVLCMSPGRIESDVGWLEVKVWHKTI